MTCVFLIHQNMAAPTMERQYLLMIAMLNFDFHVHLVFASGAGVWWQHHPQWQQKLRALELYGIDSIRHLPDGEDAPFPDWYGELLNGADFIS